MRYLGGKSRIADRLAAVVNATRGDRPFWDPFCGGLSMSVALGGFGLVSDAHPALIALYRAVVQGWDPPSTLSEEEWRSAKTLPDSDPLKAFAGFGCSFAGSWFGGYARDTPRRQIQSGPSKGSWVNAERFCANARKSVLRDVANLTARGCRFECVDFLAVTPEPTDAVLYLDPPYRGTTGYSLPFDADAFDRRVRQWARFTDVFVSEYSFAHGREVYAAPATTKGMSCGRLVKRERLYYLGPSDDRSDPLFEVLRAALGAPTNDGRFLLHADTA